VQANDAGVQRARVFDGVRQHALADAAPAKVWVHGNARNPIDERSISLQLDFAHNVASDVLAERGHDSKFVIDRRATHFLEEAAAIGIVERVALNRIDGAHIARNHQAKRARPARINNACHATCLIVIAIIGSADNGDGSRRRRNKRRRMFSFIVIIVITASIVNASMSRRCYVNKLLIGFVTCVNGRQRTSVSARSRRNGPHNFGKQMIESMQRIIVILVGFQTHEMIEPSRLAVATQIKVLALQAQIAHVVNALLAAVAYDATMNNTRATRRTKVRRSVDSLQRIDLEPRFCHMHVRAIFEIGKRHNDLDERMSAVCMLIRRLALST
jgi:hypothetical protein